MQSDTKQTKLVQKSISYTRYVRENMGRSNYYSGKNLTFRRLIKRADAQGRIIACICTVVNERKPLLYDVVNYTSVGGSFLDW